MATSKKGKWTKTGESPVEEQIKELKDLTSELAQKIEIKVEIQEKKKETVEIMRELTSEIEKWGLIRETKMNLVKFQRFDLAAEVRAMENNSVNLIQIIAASLTP